MKKIVLYSIISLFSVFVLWLLFLIIPYCRLLVDEINRESLNAAYVMAGALFTGFAFAATIANLFVQNKALKEQLAMDSLSNTINLILDSDRFRESRKYVMSKTFYLHERLLKEMKPNEHVLIEDWKKIDNTEERSNMSERNQKSYSDYEKLIFFCGRMEYLGVVLKNKGVDDTILDYFGNTIIESYKRLEPYIENSRQSFGETTYFHYSYLYHCAKLREPILKQQCKKSLVEMTNENNNN